MDRTSIPSRLLASALIAVLALFAVGFTAVAVDDYLMRDAMPKGASVAGVDVGGMTRADAVRTLETRLVAKVMAPKTVSCSGLTTTLDPSTLASVDVNALLDEAALPKAEATLPERVWQRVSGGAVGHAIEASLTIDAAALAKWVNEEQARTTVPAVDASVAVSGSKLTFKKPTNGSSIDVTASVAAISEAIQAGSGTVALDVVTTQPRITDAKLGKTIFISRSKKTLILYNGTDVEKKYRCAVGTLQFPTPLGKFRIELKRYRPTWSNPGSDWAKSMPSYIGPGPGNPLGTRALNLNSPGIRIHGTSKDYSIGTAASHGCIRMHMWDVEDLYDRVKVGTRVFIVQ
jgi:lipoprotein-anchoring transpeptidase ErfK/SrfK